MSRAKKILIGVVLTVFCVTGFLYVRFPVILLSYINSAKSGIKADNAKLLSLNCVELGGVSIELPTVKGKLDSAVVCRDDKTVNADGGFIKVVLGSGPSGGESGGGWNVTAKHLSVVVEKDDIQLFLENTSIDSKEVTAISGVVTHPNGTAKLTSVKIDRVKKTLYFEGAQAKKDEFDIKAGGVLVGSDKTIKADTISIERSGGVVVLVGVDAKYTDGVVDFASTGISLYHKMVYRTPLMFNGVRIQPFKLSDAKTVTHKVRVRDVSVEFNIDKRWVKGEAPCQAWFNAVPDELKESPIDQMKMKGDLSFSIHLLPDVDFKLRNLCRIDGGTPDFIEALRKTFKYDVYKPNSGDRYSRTSGPGSAEWIPLRLVSDNMIKVLTTTEDPGFFGHRGIIPQAIENSIRDNIKLGRFHRGGSTITMQLAKNLWLSRDRALGRKVQEAILTVALESSLTKEKIIELYLNVIEFGPNIYGIGPAAYKIVGEDPLSLSLSQAVYLAIRLPSPSTAPKFKYTKRKICVILDLMASSGKVSAQDFAFEKAFLAHDFE